MTDQNFPIQVPASTVTPILTALARQALTAGGAYLVTKGFVSQDTANTLVEQALGLAIVAGSAAWAWWKAHRTTTNMQTMADRLPDAVAVRQGA